MKVLTQDERASLMQDFLAGRRKALGLSDVDDSNDPRASVRALGRKYGISYQTACDIIVSHGYRASTRSALKGLAQDTIEQIEGMLLDTPPKTPAHIANTTGLTLQRVRRIILELAEKSA